MDNELTSTRLLQYNYWAKVKDEIDKNYPIFNSRKPQGQNWYDLAIGSSLAHISLTINTQKSEVKSHIWIDDSKSLFDYLFDLKDEIENSIGV